MEEYILEPIRILKREITKYVDEEITANELKHTAAGFGIYLQRNKQMMIRIRVTGGELSVTDLNYIYDIINGYEDLYIRVTTRQNIQLHDVKPEHANKILDILIAKGFIFRGGGGDTFRSVAVSYDSGISEDSVFDVMPYAGKLSKNIYPLEKAFNLPRKIKIAFSSDSNDSAFAKWQDLGFIARKNESGENGFVVYIGGGMGRKSVKAIKVFDFISAGDSYRCAAAMIDMFDENGNREDRSRARIRFIRERLGDEEFKRMFTEYYTETEVESLVLNNDCPLCVSDISSEKCLKNQSIDIISDSWKNIFTEKTKFNNITLVRVPISNGNLKREDIECLLNIFNRYSVNFIRINRVHELCFLILNEVLGCVYTDLNHYSGNDFTGRTFKEHIVSCIGAKVCPLGLIDSQDYAIQISEALQDKFGNSKDEKYNKLINNISVCGCGNSCGNPEAFAISVIGSKKKIDGVLTDICKIRVKKGFIKNMKCDYLIEIPSTELKDEFNKI